LEIPETLSLTVVTAWAAVYWAFRVSFWVRKALTRAWRAESVWVSLPSSS